MGEGAPRDRETTVRAPHVCVVCVWCVCVRARSFSSCTRRGGWSTDWGRGECRGLSDAEIAKLDAEALQPKEKKKWKFLQKYYHKGAFYQDDELVKETGTHLRLLTSVRSRSCLVAFDNN